MTEKQRPTPREPLNNYGESVATGRDGMQGAFLQPIAGLWAKKATQQTARDRLITSTKLFRGSLVFPFSTASTALQNSSQLRRSKRAVNGAASLQPAASQPAAQPGHYGAAAGTYPGSS